jgi:putative hydrolase of the HAD superfamily
MDRPKVIFLDAVGTLFGVQGSVGEVYSKIAHQFGVDVSATALDRAFYESFKSVEAPAFPGADPTEIAVKEFSWWLTIATQTFKQAGVLHQFANFAEFFSALYEHFSTAEPWFIYPDVLPALKHWQSIGVELGVVSNFDSRLYAVLEALDLAQFFQSITISTEVGAAKPHPKIFQVALQRHQCAAETAWHIGDSLNEDYKGARAAGLRGILLQRVDE